MPDATVGAVSVPVTLKMRLGWDHQSINAPELARRAQDAGVRDSTGRQGRWRCGATMGGSGGISRGLISFSLLP